MCVLVATLIPGRTYAPRSSAAAFGFILLLAGAISTWLTWRYFVDTWEGQRIDNAAFVGAEIGQNVLWRAAEPILDVVSVSFVVVVLAAAAFIAILRRRWLLAIQVAILVGGANVTTQALKHVVWDRPNLAETSGALMNSLPSGHATVAASVAAALLLVVPRSIRPGVAVIAAGYAAATGVATVIGGWHRPSDAVAALTVVLAWAGLTIAFTALVAPEESPQRGSAPTSVAVGSGLLIVGGGIAGVVATFALLRTRDALDSVDRLTSRQDLGAAYFGGAIGIVAVSALVYALILIGHQWASQERR
jgi:membrane-associated phospholipid phosphatase